MLTDVNLLGKNINIIKKNTVTLVDAMMEGSLEVNWRKLGSHVLSSDYRTELLCKVS
jgi:hypothetical protein